MANKTASLLACMYMAMALFSSTCTANYPATTSFLITTCENTPDPTLCLKTLIQHLDHIDQDYKKLVRLAVSDATTSAQSAADALTKLSQTPKLWQCEIDHLLDCSDSFVDVKTGFNDLMEKTYHLGGGSKAEKETKRLDMMAIATAASDANDLCVANLQEARARDEVIGRVQEATDVLVREASNIYYLLEHFPF